MPSFITPARLTAASGVATGLAAAATALTGVFTTGSSVGNAIVGATGLLTTAASVFKFLEGQSAWEVAAQAPAAATSALVMAHAPKEEPVVFEPDFSVGDATNSAELDGGEQPVEDPVDGPARLRVQLPASDAPTVPLAGGSI